MSLLSHKRHKKHKHKKHKKKRGGGPPEDEDLEEDEDFEEEEEDSGGEGNPKQGLKLKIKIGGQTFGETRLSKAGTSSADHAGSMSGSVASTSGISVQRKNVDEEEVWLAALEAGRLDEVDEELRRMKDPTLMTARQRSLLENKAHKDRELASPAAPVEKVMTEEMIQRKIIRAKKRKEQADEKREKDKKQTIERLLKKADAKVKSSKRITRKSDVPKMSYRVSQADRFSLLLPVGFEYPLQAQAAKQPPPVVLCGVKGCKNRKKYSCSKTGVPLCSLECYKKNLNLS